MLRVALGVLVVGAVINPVEAARKGHDRSPKASACRKEARDHYPDNLITIREEANRRDVKDLNGDARQQHYRECMRR